MIELIFRLCPCHVNEMTFASVLCVFLLFCLAVCIPKSLRQETGVIIIVELCGKLDCSSEKVTSRSPP